MNEYIPNDDDEYFDEEPWAEDFEDDFFDEDDDLFEEYGDEFIDDDLLTDFDGEAL